MFSRHIAVLTILGLFAGGVVGMRSRRSVYYQGPPAPLNHDGTVAKTAEVQNAAAAQKAAFATEFNRLQEAERLAAAHPDFTSHSYSKGNQNLQSYKQGNSFNYPQSYNPAPLNQDGTVALTPEVQQARAAHQAALAAEYQRYQEAAILAAAHPDFTSPQKGYGTPGSQYNFKQQPQYNQQSHYNQQPQYNQQSHYNQQPQYNQQSHYNQQTQYNQQSHYNQQPQYNQQSHYNQQPQYNQQPSYAYNPSAWIPAPLNQDGTVAHTADYKAIAAAHQAEYSKVLQNVKYQNTLAHSKQESGYSNNYW